MLHLFSGKPHYASRVILAVSLSLLVCAGAAIIVQGLGSGQMFEDFGAAKRYGLPATYVIFTLVMVLPYRGMYPRPQFPVWWWTLLAILTISTAGSFFYVRQSVQIIDLAQSVALITGVLLISWAGLTAGEWHPRQEYALVYVVGISAFSSAVLNIPLGPFVSISAPATLGLLYAAIRLKKGRIPYLLIAGFVGFSTLSSLLEQRNPSISQITQLIVCAVLLVVAVLPHPLRIVSVIGGVIGAVYMLFSTSIVMLMKGEAPSSENDVTLTHRAYEAAMVEGMIESNTWSSLFGMGPSATVDLSSSPDRVTLFVSGRDVTAVDDVHFLTSWVLLKFGISGVIWLVLLAIAMVREGAHILTPRRPAVFDVILLMFVFAGGISGLPGATNLFANPLAFLFLGILIARRRLRASKKWATKQIAPTHKLAV
jgi:hypothetical protein